jgi:hypothetical protein
MASFNKDRFTSPDKTSKPFPFSLMNLRRSAFPRLMWSFNFLFAPALGIWLLKARAGLNNGKTHTIPAVCARRLNAAVSRYLVTAKVLPASAIQ